MELNLIRSSFLKFFELNGHKIMPSSSLIPAHDPTLLFTNSGMVQFKNYFTGAQHPIFAKATTAQKCIRAGGKHNDLENVGYTARHHTFFEMLGNFAFQGEYFKTEAIEYAWNYLVKELKIDKSKLYITVYHEDDEAYNIWKKLTGFNDNKIIKITNSDNFWSMGDLGPCGPCSEIFFDHGPKYQGGLPGTDDEGGDRYIEIWNLVFMQYEQLDNNKQINLPKPAIDTGMGLERIAAVLQGVNDNYDIDLFKNLRDISIELSGNKGSIESHKVIADHLRSICFLIADGIMPSNESRGYVLRRIMRRAMRHVNKLGVKEPMIYKMVPALVSEMREAYPELQTASSTIQSILKTEEERFAETLDRGLKVLEDFVSNITSGGILKGELAFNLYDTYGFPLDLTKDILRVRNIDIDEEGFDIAMHAQKQRARAAWAGSGEQSENRIWYDIYEKYGSTEFVGYEKEQVTAKVIAIVVGGVLLDSVNDGNAIVIFDKTPFYGESGGQVGDVGKADHNKVIDVKKYAEGIFAHYIEIQKPIKCGQHIELIVDHDKRLKTKANHSATHLLHKALRDILGSHVMQKGSIVTPEKLRFDFAHGKPLSIAEINEVEVSVNKMIIANNKALLEICPHQDAMKKGAIALFGEKYSEEVRVISLGLSVELCGGTHVNNTGDIGYFKIINEESIASGVRRIEALTGIAAVNFINSKQKILKDLSLCLKSSENELFEKITAIQNEFKNTNKQLNYYKSEFFAAGANIENFEKYDLVHSAFDNVDINDLKNISEVIKKKYKNSIICLIARKEELCGIFIMVSGQALEIAKASELVDIFKQDAGGNGGGNQNFAQLGGSDYKKSISCIDKIKLKLK